MIDTTYIGKTYPIQSYSITRKWISDFIQSIGGNEKDYFDNHTHQLTAPLTFSTCFRKAEFQVIEDLQIDLKKILHGEQNYQFFKSIKEGSTVFTTLCIKDIYSKGSLTFLILETSCANENQEIISIGQTNIIIRDSQ